MNVLLISTPKLEGLKASRGTLPVALMYLAASLRKSDHVPYMLDLSVATIPDETDPIQHFFELVIGEIKDKEPGLVGVNCFSSMHFPLIRKLLEKLRKAMPEIEICLGGAHPTFYHREILEHCPDVNYIVVGEGEEQTAALADVLESGDRSGLRGIQSFAYKDDEGQVVVNPRLSYLPSLDSLPMAAYDLIDITKYYSDHSNWHNPKNKEIRLSVPILTTRSCPFNCAFCSAYSIMGRDFRRRDPLKVVDEIEILSKEYGQDYFTFVDDNVNLKKDHFLAICGGIAERNLDIQISISQGMYLNSVDREVVEAFVRAGGVTVSAPIESGSDYIRNEVIGKNLKKEKIIEAVDLFHEFDLFAVGLFIMGFEEDTTETLDETLELIHQLKLDVNAVSTLVPFPGTRIYDKAKKNGHLLLDDSDIWTGETFFDPQNKQQFFIQPFALDLDELRKYRKAFDELYFYTDRARTLNPQA